MEIIGFIGALIIGITLGLIGGGGSILAVPILIYLFTKDVSTATAYSLFIVGITAFFGTIKHHKKGNIKPKITMSFAIPSFIGVFLTRAYLLPAIPEEIWTINEFVLTKRLLIMTVFAILMLVAAFSMIRSSKKETIEEIDKAPIVKYHLIMLEGIIVGALTGFIGAGGGFLIIPALVLLAKLPMKMAIGTSLAIVTFKSLFGFFGDVISNGLEVEWMFLLSFSGLAIIGIFIGDYFHNKVNPKNLKKGFGFFVFFMSLFIIWKEFLA